MHEAHLSVRFPGKNTVSGLPFPPPGELPDPGIDPTSSMSTALQEIFLLLSHEGSPFTPETNIIL